MVDNNHTCLLENFEILHIENKGLRLDRLEAWEIQSAALNGNILINEQIDLYKSPLLYLS